MKQRLTLISLATLATLAIGCGEKTEGKPQTSAIVPSGTATVVATGTSIQVGGAPKTAAPAGAPPAPTGKPDDGGW